MEECALVPPKSGTTTKQQIQQASLNQFCDSAPGSAVGFVSPLQMIPGWGQEPAKNISETVAGGSAKVLVVKTIADNAGQPTVQTLFSNPGTSIEVPCAIWHTQVDRSLLVSWTRGQVNK